MSNIHTPEPSVSAIKAALDYDPEAGVFFWKERKPSSFLRRDSHRAWNGQYAGKQAFTSISKAGYAVGAYNYRQLKAHRVAWAITHGRWPTLIDHINGNKADNRIANLREVTNAENGRNCRRTSHNKTGVAGVSWSRQARKFRVMIQANGRREYLGGFASLEEAARVRKAAERRLGFHENHGRSA